MRVNRSHVAHQLHTWVLRARHRLSLAHTNTPDEHQAVKELHLATQLHTLVSRRKGEGIGQREIVEHLTRMIRSAPLDVPLPETEARRIASTIAPLVAIYLSAQQQDNDDRA